VPTPSARLRRTLELVDPAFATPGRLLLEHPRVSDLYPRYLAATTHLTLSLVPLMEVALVRARELGPADSAAVGLVPYLERHIEDELHGDEPGQEALDDLEALGVDTAALLAEPPPAKVAALIGTLFFWIRQRHPVAVLGMLELEAYPPQAETVEEMIARTGLPRDGFRQLLLHSELDVEHADELHRLLDSLPLEPEHERLIAQSVLHTITSLIDAWLDVLRDAEPAAHSVSSVG
jgi:Iron-containing redox enzyme